MTLPKDPIILLSYLNTMLRDNYQSLEDLCRSLDVDQPQLMKQMESIEYEYDSEQNRFISMR